VFGFLPLASLGRLDAAVAHKGHRLALLEAFLFVTVTLPLVDSYIHCEKQIWRWCVDRAVTVKQLNIANNVESGEELNLLEKVLLRVPQHELVRYVTNLRTDLEAYTSRVLCNATIRRKITSLTLRVSDGPEISIWKWGDVLNVKSLTISGEKLAEQALQHVLLGIFALESVFLFAGSLLSSDTVQALVGHGASLVRISLHDTHCHSQLLHMVGQHCHNLKELVVLRAKETSGSSPWADQEGWIAVARGCRKLSSVTVYFWADLAAGLTESALLAFAGHCTELEVFSLAATGTTVTDAVLLALSVGCPKLQTLLCDKWAVRSVDTVDAAQHLLSRMEDCPIVCSSIMPPAVLARAVSHLRSVEFLSLRNLSAVHVKALHRVTIRLTRCDSLCLYGENEDDVMVAVDEFVLAVASISARLHTIQIGFGAFIAESTLVQVGGMCPSVRHVECADNDYGEGSESALLTLVHRWPLLECFCVARNEKVTDAVLRAMMQHCPHMSYLDLSEAAAVTEATLLEMVHLLPDCDYALPEEFSEQALDRMHDAIEKATAKRDFGI
jgi:hypothetical protein